MAGIIEIQKKSIVDLDTDAVVNAANEALAAGGGVCGAIFAAAGHSEMQAACRAIGHCETGNAVITPGFKLKAKYVIHAVGPRYTDGRHGEAEKLRQAYKKAIALAAENGCWSIGFPLISAGIFGYPAEDAWKEAFRGCREALDELKDKCFRVVFAVINDKAAAEGKAILRRSDAVERHAHLVAFKNDKHKRTESHQFPRNQEANAVLHCANGCKCRVHKQIAHPVQTQGRTAVGIGLHILAAV